MLKKGINKGYWRNKTFAELIKNLRQILNEVPVVIGKNSPGRICSQCFNYSSSRKKIGCKYVCSECFNKLNSLKLKQKKELPLKRMRNEIITNLKKLDLNLFKTKKKIIVYNHKNKCVFISIRKTKK